MRTSFIIFILVMGLVKCETKTADETSPKAALKQAVDWIKTYVKPGDKIKPYVMMAGALTYFLSGRIMNTGASLLIAAAAIADDKINYHWLTLAIACARMKFTGGKHDIFIVAVFLLVYSLY